MVRHVASGDGVPIAYDVSGEGGPTAVLVHGWSCDRSYWKHQLTLGDHFRIVTVDLAGHGQSGCGRADWTIPAFGDDVIAVIEQLTGDDLVLIGHSLGGNACLEAARRLDDSVRGLVWIDTYGTLDVLDTTPSVADITAPFRADFVGATRAFVESMFLPEEDPIVARWVVDDMSSAPASIAVSCIVASLTYGRDAHALVDDEQTPIVALNSDYLGADIESLNSHGVEVRLLPGSGHFPMLTDVERFNALLGDTVARFEP